MNKKAQSLKDFIITYGLTISAVIIAILALSYFGIFNPSLLPERCYLPDGFGCAVNELSSSGIKFSFINNLEKDILLREINISQIAGCADKNINLSIAKGQSAELVLPCNLSSVKMINSEFLFVYDEADGLKDVRKIGAITKKNK